MRLEATTQCGPLLLPSDLVDEKSRNARRFVIDDLRWNPDLPAEIASSTEQLSQRRER